MPGFATWLYTKWNGKQVGADDLGNRYYVERRSSRRKDSRRWVIYEGAAEASRVPPAWHRWLHRTTDDLPTDSNITTQPWEKPHQPNQTGTDEAYRPPGSELRGGERARGTGDYEPWVPS